MSAVTPELLHGSGRIEGTDGPRRAASPPGERYHARDLGSTMRNALRRALDRLPVAERNLVREYYFERQTIVEIGRSRGVHKASVSRWLKQLRGRILREMKRDLGPDFPRTAEEIGQLLDSLDEDPSESPIMGA